MDFAYLPNGKTVTFEGENGKHDYYLEGRKKPSVTTIMQIIGISQKYANTDNVRLLADFGTQVHNEIDAFEKTGKLGMTKECRFWSKYGHPLAEKWDTEVLFATDRFAGRVDAIGHCADGSFILMDHKTGKVHDYVNVQLSFYLKGLKECGILPPDAKVRLMVYDADGDNGSFIDVDEVPGETLEEMLDCYENGRRYIAPYLPIKTKSWNYCRDAKVSLIKAYEALDEAYSSCLELGSDETAEHIKDLIVSAQGRISSVECCTTWSHILAHIPTTDLYAFSKRLADDVEDFEKELKEQMKAADIGRAKTSDGYLWTLSEYETSTFSQALLLKNYPKLGPKILKKCKAASKRTRLTFKGKEETEADVRT